MTYPEVGDYRQKLNGERVLSIKNLPIKVYVLIFSVLSQLIFACAIYTPHTALKNATLPELIPRKTFFNSSKNKSDYLISPDGKKLAWLEEYHGSSTIFFKPIGAEKVGRINTRSWCHVDWYTWAQDSRHFIYTLDVGPKRACHIYKVDSEFPDKESVDLTPEAESLAFFEAGSPFDPENVLLSQDKHSYENYDLYKVNLKSGAEKLIGQSKEAVVEWILDRKGRLRGRIRADKKRCLNLDVYDRNKAGWTRIAVWGPDESVRSYGMTPDEEGVWLLSDKNRDRAALVRFDLKFKREIVVYEVPDADIEDVYISPVTGKALLAYSHPDYPRTQGLEPELKADLAAFKETSPFGVEVLSMDDTENFWTVRVFNEKRNRYYLYNRTSKQKTLLAHSQWTDNSDLLADTQPVTIKSRDGIALKGYLTRPAGNFSLPLPMVLLVHGGPWSRDYWEPDRMVQFLANRGYAVLQVNFRGSTGYGRAYKESAKKEFAKNMHNDLIDAVQWSVDRKIADPEKSAIVGGSYGGFAAMAGLAFTPEVFTCAISINGVSDWAALINSFPAILPLYQKRGYEIWYDYVGNPENETEKEDIRKRSPLFFADRVRKPILIVHGERDGIVDPIHSIKMIEALKKHGKQVIHKHFENEGHGFTWTRNSEKLYQEMEKFLARHLGGRYEG